MGRTRVGDGHSLTIESDNFSLGFHGSPFVRNSYFENISFQENAIQMFHFSKYNFLISEEIWSGFWYLHWIASHFPQDHIFTLSSHWLDLKMWPGGKPPEGCYWMELLVVPVGVATKWLLCAGGNT